MTNKEVQKKICRKCDGIGHFQVYEASCVKRRYCDCETGKRQKEFIASITQPPPNPVWELFIL